MASYFDFRTDLSELEQSDIKDMVSILSRDCNSVYMIDMEKRLMIPCVLNNGVANSMWETVHENRDYEEMFQKYAEKTLPVTEQDRFLQMTSIITIQAKLEQDCSYRYCFPRYNEKGEIEFVEMAVYALHKKDLKKVVMVFRNVTQEEEGKKALALNDVHQVMGNGSFTFTFEENGEILEVSYSDTFRELLGYEDEMEYPNILGSWLEDIEKKDLEELDKNFWEPIRAVDGGDAIQVEYRLRTKADGYKWFRTVGKLTRNSEGKAVTFYGILQDISAEKDSEKLLEKTNKEREEQYEVLLSMAHIYTSMYLLDLARERHIEYFSNEAIRSFISHGDNLQENMESVIKNLITEEYREKALEFSNLTTVSERLMEKKQITEDVEGIHLGKVRLGFIAIDKGNDGVPTRVLFTAQTLD